MDVIDSQLCGYYRQHIRGVKLLHWSSRQMYQLETTWRYLTQNLASGGGTFALDIKSKAST